MAKQAAGLVDPRLAKALSHPMRARILTILNERVASPNEIAEMIDERLPNVSYHVRALLELGCIELVSTAAEGGHRALLPCADETLLQRPRLEAAPPLRTSSDIGRRPPDDLGRRVDSHEGRHVRQSRTGI